MLVASGATDHYWEAGHYWEEAIAAGGVELVRMED